MLGAGASIWLVSLLCLGTLIAHVEPQVADQCNNYSDGEGSAALDSLESRLAGTQKQLDDALAIISRQEQRLSQLQAGLATSAASIAALAHDQGAACRVAAQRHQPRGGGRLRATRGLPAH
jgi:hypothetical protein